MVCNPGTPTYYCLIDWRWSLLQNFGQHRDGQPRLVRSAARLWEAFPS
jgi:hypothetical protein